jgi:hypothetical protein
MQFNYSIFPIKMEGFYSCLAAIAAVLLIYPIQMKDYQYPEKPAFHNLTR